MKNQRRAIVLDFDGTVADTVPLIQAIYKDLAPKKGWTELTDEAYIELRKGSLSDARKWAGIRAWQLPAVVKSAKQLLSLESEKVTIFPGMIGLIRELSKDENTDLYLLSRNTQETIRAVLERKGLSDDLTILTMPRFFGGKTLTLRRLAAKHKYRKRNIWMVGDEVRDIRAAKRARVRSIAVTWGLQDVSILKRYRPNHIVDTVDELKQHLQS